MDNSATDFVAAFYTMQRERDDLRTELERAQVHIAELVEQANSAYAPYREDVMAARAEMDKYATRAYKLEQALRPLLEACYRADEQEELSEFVDGSLLDAAKDALEE